MFGPSLPSCTEYIGNIVWFKPTYHSAQFPEQSKPTVVPYERATYPPFTEGLKIQALQDLAPCRLGNTYQPFGPSGTIRSVKSVRDGHAAQAVKQEILHYLARKSAGNGGLEYC